MKSPLQKTLRAFRRQVLKAREAVEDSPEASELHLKIAVENGTATSSFDGPEQPARVRFAVLMRPLIHGESAIACDRVWKALTSEVEVEGKLKQYVEDRFSRLNRATFALDVNGRPLTPHDVYSALADGELFSTEPTAARLLKALRRFGPMRAMVWFQFYDYCYKAYGVAEAILEAVFIHAPRTDLIERGPCVYCNESDGTFSSEEHVVPEALGNDDAVLPVGWVCDDCNNSLSYLDEYLANFEGVAFSRVLNVPFTKKGKLPKASYAGVEIEKRLPRSIRLLTKDRSQGVQNFESFPDGSFRFKVKLRGKKPLDAAMLARSLCKMGLGMVAYQAGRERACDPRYDATRRFLRGEGPSPTNIGVSTKSEPNSTVRFWWWDEEVGTICVADFFGMIVIFNLENEPKLALDPDDPMNETFTTLVVE